MPADEPIFKRLRRQLEYSRQFGETLVSYREWIRARAHPSLQIERLPSADPGGEQRGRIRLRGPPCGEDLLPRKQEAEIPEPARGAILSTRYRRIDPELRVEQKRSPQHRTHCHSA